MKKHFTFIAVAVFCSAIIAAQNQTLNTQSISIFKNGQAFFIKSGTLKSTDGKFLLPSPTPQALYGTLWFNSPEGTLTRVVSYPDTLLEKTNEKSVAIWDLLRTNTGKTLSGVVDDKGSVAGKLISVSPAYKNEKGEPVFSAQSLVTIQSSQERWITIPAGQIRYVTFNEPPNLEVETSKVTPRHLIEVNFSNKKAEQPIDMMYLANGLNWAPQYLLELKGETYGKLTLQGEVANDAEDITNTTLNLVIGVPNFVYANRLSFLVDFLNVIMPFNINGNLARNVNNVFSNALMAQQLGYSGDAESSAAPDEAEGMRNEDLFFYTLKNFSLPKGGRSIQPIFEEKTDLAHIYECKLPDNDSNTRFYEPDFLFSPQKNKVFHTLRLENKTKQPWTTASIMVMNAQGERRPISQDLLRYTPVGGKTYVKLTEAVDVKVEQAERETGRQSAVWSDKRNGYKFDLVQVEGKIKVKNFKDKKLDLRLQRTIIGNLKKSSVEWQKEEVINTNNPRNRKTNVCWETSVKANGELEITYSYEIYLPSY